MKKGGWFSEKVTCDEETKDNCIGDYNRELMDPLEPVLSRALVAIVLITAVIDIIAYKKRWLAEHFQNIECVMRIVAIMVPSSYGYDHRNNILHVVTFGGIAMMLLCGSGYHIIFLTLTLLFNLIVGKEVNYGGSNFGPITLITTFAITVIFFGAISVVGILLIYIYE